MVRITFSSAPAGTAMTRTNFVTAGGANWATNPPPVIYAVNATVPHANAWNTALGRSGRATIPAGGSVSMTYAWVNGDPLHPVTVTITIPAFAGALGTPPRPTVQWNVAGGNLPHSHHITSSGGDYDIAITF